MLGVQRGPRRQKSLKRLTYWNAGKAYLFFGADAEWEKLSRHNVLEMRFKGWQNMKI